MSFIAVLNFICIICNSASVREPNDHGGYNGRESTLCGDDDDGGGGDSDGGGAGNSTHRHLLH